MRRLAVALAALTLTAPAAATDLTAQSLGTLQAWTDAAKVPTPPGRLTVTIANCPAYEPNVASCHVTGRIWLAPAHAHNRGVFLHELGHEYDDRVLDRQARDAFMALTHRRVWKHDLTGADELFASAYSLCALHRHLTPATTVIPLYGWWPTPRVHDKACAIIRAAWTRRNRRFYRRYAS